MSESQYIREFVEEFRGKYSENKDWEIFKVRGGSANSLLLFVPAFLRKLVPAASWKEDMWTEIGIITDEGPARPRTLIKKILAGLRVPAWRSTNGTARSAFSGRGPISISKNGPR